MILGIVGNYGNDNQGDEAILEGMIVQFEQAYQLDRSDMVVFSNNPSQTRKKFGVQSESLYKKKRNAPLSLLATIKERMSTIRKLDMLVIGGGGILMDLYRNGLVLFSVYGWMAKRTQTPFVIYGAGAGPVNTWFGKRMLRSLGKGASLVTVRDEKSKALLASIGVKAPIHVISDPAFYVPAPAQQKLHDQGMDVGVTAIPFHNPDYWPGGDQMKYDRYVKGMAHNLDKLLATNPQVNVHFFSTKHPQDTKVSQDIQSLMQYQDRCDVCERGLDQQEIVQFISDQDMVIGTRLHSLILATVAKKPIIAVSYHPKVEDFMEMVDLKDSVIVMETLDQQKDAFLTLYTEMDRNWANTCDRFSHVAETMKNKQPKGTDLLWQLKQQLEVK